MKKCTLCVDRIYDENLPEDERQPACVLTCPSHARYFGDFDDPNSEVSVISRERGGESLMPEMGYEPVNKYLPPRAKTNVQKYVNETKSISKVKDWVNRLVSR
jgi:Fe-S-cluster-containing dehydrogenase component